MREEEVVEGIRKILEEKKENGGVESEKLEGFIPHLTLPLVNSILSCKTLRSHPTTLLSFFNWLQTHAPPPLRSSPHALLTLLPPLLFHRKFSHAKSLLVSFISSDRTHALHALLLHPRRPLPKPLLDTALAAYVHAGQPLLAFHLFQKMKRLRLTPNLLTCNTLLNSLVRSLSSHSTLLASGVFHDAVALGVKPNTNTFNILIYGQCHHKKFDHALALVHRMPEFGCFPDNVTYNTILDALCKKGQLNKVRDVLTEMKNAGLVANRNTYNILVHGYCRLKWLKEAAEVIDLMTKDGMLPDVWTYNTLVRGLCDEGKIDEAIRVRDEMVVLKLMPDVVTYNTLIDGSFKWCGSVEGFRLIEEMRLRGVEMNVVTHNIVVKWLCKEGKIDEASEAVVRMVESEIYPDRFTYNTMINGYCKAGKLGEAFKMMDEMAKKGLKPDVFTLNSVLHTLCMEKKLEEAYELIVQAGKRGYILDEVTYGTLIMGHFKAEQGDKALKLWEEMKGRGIIPSVVTYNTLIRGLCLSRKIDEAVDKLNELLEKGLVPDEATCNIIIHGYCWEGMVEKAFQFHNKMVGKSFKPDIFTRNILLRGLCREGMLEKAFKLFNSLVSKEVSVDVVTYNTLISAVCKEGRLEEAFDLITEMEGKKLEPDRYTYNPIVDALTHAGRTEEAEKFMSKLLQTGQDVKTHDTSEELDASGDIIYSEKISDLCTQGKYKEAMKLFQESEQKGVGLNKFTYIKLMDGFLKRRKSISKVAKIQILCPSITGNVCCTADQFDTLRVQVQQAVPILVGCPSCLRNFLNLFCELSCSPHQSLFINVTSISEVNGNMTVDGIDFYVTETFGEGLYESCKDVKFGTMNTRAIDFVGAGASNFKEWFEFLGQKVPPGLPGSPYSILFKTATLDPSPMKLMNASVYSCNDTSLGCSCGDCPSSSVCSAPEPSPPSKDPCAIRIWSLKVRCVDFSLAILYIVLVFVLFGWALQQGSRGRRRPESSVEPLLNDMVGEGSSLADLQKDGNHPVEVQQLDPQGQNVVQFSFVQGWLSSFYRTYGRWAARNPTIVLCSSLAIVVLLCLGLLRFQVETRPEKLWVGPGSKAAEEKDFFDNQLAPFYRIEQLIIATIPESKHGKPPSIITEENIQLLFEIQEKVDGIRANYSGLLVSLSDICLKPLGEDCATQSILQYFQMDPDNYDNYGGVEHAEYCFEHYTSTETCFSAFKAPLEPTTALGGFSGNNYSEASAFVITYPVNNAIMKVGDENGKAIAWEKAFIQLAKEELLPMVQTSNLTLSFSTESSIEEELKRESTADVITILVSYIVMFAYISVTLGDTPRHPSSFFLSSKVLLGLLGVLLVMLSVLGSVGFFSAIGVKSTLIIMEVIPFLVLAVGVDNMCIIVDAVKRQPSNLSVEEKISNAMGEVGPSITLASVSEILAFAVGSFVSMPACRVFSMIAALAVLLDFLLQITAFVALVTLDFVRAKDNRIDCFPCIKLNRSSENEGNRQEKDGLLTQYMKEVHAPFLGLRVVKILVIAIFVGFTLASIALCTRIEPGLEQQIALPRDSYLQGYFSNISEYLRVGPPLYFVVKDYNYSLESKHTNQLCSISHCDSNSLLNEISRASLVPKSSYIAKPAASWLDDFLVWMSPEAFSCCRKFTNGSYCPPDDQPPCCLPDEGPCGLGGVCQDCTTCFLHSDLVNDRPSTAQFREKLPWFLDALPSADCAKGGHGAYTNSVDLNGYESGVIQASEFRTYHTPLNSQGDYVNAIQAARDFSSRISTSLKMDIFPYSVFYIFFEQYLDIWKLSLINITIALGAIFVVCLVITSSLWSSAIVLLVLVMIILDLMGVMAILGIQLNAVSVVNLVMSLGIAVEFCVHIVHAFTVSLGDRSQRAKTALCTVGASVFSGITLTKLVGVIVLCFSTSELFVVYYFQMYLALVIIGFLHGLVFLPVLLSLFGPPLRYTVIKEQLEDDVPYELHQNRASN